MAENGFIDLRIGHGTRGPGDDSVWPSFSDIMTVVVMIFLMALVIIMVRNSVLNRELLNSMEINQAISSDNLELTSELTVLRTDLQAMEEVLDDAESTNRSLNQKLANEAASAAALRQTQETLEQEITHLTGRSGNLSSKNLELLALRNRLIRENRALGVDNAKLRAARENLANQLGQQLSENTSLSVRLEDLIEDQDRLTSEKTVLEQEKRDLIDDRRTLNILLQKAESISQSLVQDKQDLAAEVAGLTSVQGQLQGEIENLTQLIRERDRTNRDLQSDVEQQGLRFASLQEEYEDLEVRYRGLIRAARTSAGKDVAQVAFRRHNGVYEYRLTNPGESESRVLSRAELERELTVLQNRYGRNLYTRVIIPEVSGLSYNEALQFTNEILNQFDYYYQPVERENRNTSPLE